MSLEDLAKQYTDLGLPMQVDGALLRIEHARNTFTCEPDETWRKTIDAFFKAKQYAFDEARHILKAYKCIEIQLVRLSPVFAVRSEYEYTDMHKGNLKIATASPEFCLAYMTSNSNMKPLDLIKRRLESRAEHLRKHGDGSLRLHRFNELLVMPYTARYSVSRKTDAAKLLTRATTATKSALFKLAYTTGDCLELREAIMPTSMPAPKPEPLDNKIPNVAYNDDLLKYYKVAKSSIFPNQQFLSYYHVLEYYFLRVSDENLHTSVKAIVNAPTFSSSYENLTRLLGTLKKHDNSSDETEMLKAVLSKYVDEEELISFVQDLEQAAGEKVYSDSKKKVFGQAATINLQKGHALHAAARVTKQIRNALVHSSDKYNREDCFLPLSESEHVVRMYVPLVRFLAERVIYATSAGA